MKEDGALKGSLQVGRRPEGLLEEGRSPEGLLTVGRSPEGLLKEAGFGQRSRLPWPKPASLAKAGFFRPKACFFGQKPASSGQSRLFWPEEPASSGQSRLLLAESRLLSAKAGYFLAKAGFFLAKAGFWPRRSRLTPAYAGFTYSILLEKPAYAGLRRLLLAQEEAGSRRLTPAPLGATEGSRLTPAQPASFWPKRSRLLAERKPANAGLSAGFFPLGATGKEPAFLAKAGSFLWPKEPAFPGQKPALFLGQKEPAFAGFRRLLFSVGRHGSSRLLWPEYVTSWRDKRATRLLNDVIFGDASGEAGSFCGKHSSSAQRKTMSRRKPAFLGFSWVQKAGFAGFGQNRSVPAKRGPYYLRWEPDLVEAARRVAEGLFLTGKEGS